MHGNEAETFLKKIFKIGNDIVKGIVRKRKSLGNMWNDFENIYVFKY